MSSHKSRTITIPFRTIAVWGTTSASLVLQAYDMLPSTFGGRVATAGTIFEYFRFTKLRVTQTVSFGGTTLVFSGSLVSNGVTQYLAAAWDGHSDFGTVTSQGALANMPKFTFQNGYNKATMGLSMKELVHQRPVKWWRTTTTGSPPYDSNVQGTVFSGIDMDSALSSNCYVTILFEGDCQFSGDISSAIEFRAQAVGRPVAAQSLRTGPDDDEKSTGGVVLVP
jgi:hypothetical protein